MKTIPVCKYCGSPNVAQDAIWSYRDNECVLLDNYSCGDCGEDGATLILDVEVPDDFDVYTERYAV